jgi:hypothetical protein
LGFDQWPGLEAYSSQRRCTSWLISGVIATWLGHSRPTSAASFCVDNGRPSQEWPSLVFDTHPRPWCPNAQAHFAHRPTVAHAGRSALSASRQSRPHRAERGHVGVECGGLPRERENEAVTVWLGGHLTHVVFFDKCRPSLASPGSAWLKRSVRNYLYLHVRLDPGIPSRRP